MSRKTAITDAAITIVAAHGIHGLTHRAVDREADLPEGSTSYYFRTRAALLAATVERLAELDEVELPALTAPDLNALADASARLLHRWMTVDRARQLARYELALEASRRPELREALVRSGARVRRAVAQLLAEAGLPEPEKKANQLAALLDGLLFDQVAGASADVPGVADLADTTRRLIRVLADDAGRHPPPSP